MKNRRKLKEVRGPESFEIQEDIEQLTAAGQNALIQGDYTEALDNFKKAFKASLLLSETKVQQACAFNLGAAYVEYGKPQKGLEFLKQAQPGENGERVADLQYNLGAAYEGLKEPTRAAKHYLKAAQLYRSQGKGSSEGDACMKLAHCYLLTQDRTHAVESYQRAGESYRVAGRLDAAAPALKEAADGMRQCDDFTTDDVIGVLTECLELSIGIKDEEAQGKLYNDIGLTFIQLKLFQEAAECFKRALPLVQSKPRRLAEVLQNLGAVFNTLGQHQEALDYHQEAAALHGSLGSRSAQGQCFSNLAFALSQLGKHEEAGENYLHALQAFKDTDDPQGQWQACEGLGEAQVELGDPERATLYFKQALRLLAKCKDCPGSVQERLVDKLSDALQDRLSLQSRQSHGRALTPALPQSAQVLGNKPLPASFTSLVVLMGLNFTFVLQNSAYDGRPVLRRGSQERVLYKQVQLRSAGVTSAKPSELHWPQANPQNRRLDFNHQATKELPNGHGLRDRSLEAASDNAVPGHGWDHQALEVPAEDWDGDSPPLVTGPQFGDTQTERTRRQTVLHEANRNLNNTYVQPAAHYWNPAVLRAKETGQRGGERFYQTNRQKMSELNSNTSLAQSSDLSGAGREATIPIFRRLKSQVCTVM